MMLGTPRSSPGDPTVRVSPPLTDEGEETGMVESDGENELSWKREEMLVLYSKIDLLFVEKLTSEVLYPPF